jgi:pilus assembly protein CpaB
MGRRTVLLIVAVLIAALGTSMVFLYVRGADNRAMAAQAPVQVLKAVQVINPGEGIAQAQAAGKIQMGTVPRSQVLTGAVNSTSTLSDKVALATIYPGEQIITAKFGSPGDQEVLSIPEGDIAISVNLSDTGRVAGFVNPGAEVAIFLSGEDAGSGDAQNGEAKDGTRLLLPRVSVIAVGATTVTSTTTTTPEGTQTTEQLPKTLFTLAVDQDQAERIMYAAGHGELSFALLNDKSKVKTGPGVTGDNLFR